LNLTKSRMKESYYLSCLAKECLSALTLIYQDPEEIDLISEQLNKIFGVISLIKERGLIPDAWDHFHFPDEEYEEHKLFECLMELQNKSLSSIQFGLHYFKPGFSDTNAQSIDYEWNILQKLVDGLGVFEINHILIGATKSHVYDNYSIFKDSLIKDDSSEKSMEDLYAEFYNEMDTSMDKETPQNLPSSNNLRSSVFSAIQNINNNGNDN